jgi:tRNA uridine 5-carbamoylmethylation protein Kti12
MQLYYPLSDKELFLMRGYPGSGKSTTARQLAQLFGSSAVVYSTDDFFHTDGNPNNEDSYQFDVSKLADYHSQNIARTIQAMKDEIRLVIVDNTNLTLLNMQPYVQAALDQ